MSLPDLFGDVGGDVSDPLHHHLGGGVGLLGGDGVEVGGGAAALTHLTRPRQASEGCGAGGWQYGRHNPLSFLN